MTISAEIECDILRCEEKLEYHLTCNLVHFKFGIGKQRALEVVDGNPIRRKLQLIAAFFFTKFK